jgi:hypothetical protein
LAAGHAKAEAHVANHAEAGTADREGHAGESLRDSHSRLGETLPREAPERSLEALSHAAAAARDALACPTCKSTGFVTRLAGGRETAQRCPVCRGAGGTGITAEVYVKLCHLAETATHADPGNDDVREIQQGLVSLFRKAADRPEKQDAIGRHAAQRMNVPAGEACGILLVGTIERKEPLGPYHATRLVLLGEPVPVVVVSETPVPFAPGERALVAGSVIRDPTTELRGYPGPRGPVVWGGMPLRLEE